MKTKLSLVVEAIKKDDFKKALSIAAKFSDLGEFKSEIVRAHECITNPRFYESIGVDVNEAIEIGKKSLLIRYSSSL
jgi:hypothetical protein